MLLTKLCPKDRLPKMLTFACQCSGETGELIHYSKCRGKMRGTIDFYQNRQRANRRPRTEEDLNTNGNLQV